MVAVSAFIKVSCVAIARADLIVKTVVVLIKVSTFRATGVPGHTNAPPTGTL